MIPSELGGAVSTRVSNELGAGHPQAAQLAEQVVFVLAVTEGLLIGTIMILVRHIWGNAYSNEKEVVNYVAFMMPILAVSNFSDGLQAVLSGTARGCGWQKIGAFVSLGSYYLVGIPSAVLLAFVLHVGGKGLWVGIICALLVQVFSLLIITIRTNWEQAKWASERVFDAANPVWCHKALEVSAVLRVTISSVIHMNNIVSDDINPHPRIRNTKNCNLEEMMRASLRKWLLYDAIF
ncbi:hypothetical protein MKX01_027569 [Papaver californicum]|nr:hypothetical protein MKX01_027569 [Papaver californicum]